MEAVARCAPTRFGGNFHSIFAENQTLSSAEWAESRIFLLTSRQFFIGNTLEFELARDGSIGRPL